MKTDQNIMGDLIRIASILAQCRYLPSDNIDDYQLKTYSSRKVAEIMEDAHEKSKDLAIKIRQVVERMKNDPGISRLSGAVA